MPRRTVTAAGSPPQIPLFDLRLSPADLNAVARTLRSGWLTMGPLAAAFEEAFAAQLGCGHAVAVSSCTAALHLAYLAAGVGPGDEVIVPSYTFAATANAVLYCGAEPVFADIVGPRDLGIDPDDVAARLTARTKAVTAVHFAGYPAAVDRLRTLCDAHGLALIEDAAHSPSARLGDRKLGTWGLAGCFSFFSNKVLPAGEGGLLATDSAEVAELARRWRSHGMTSETWERHACTAGDYDVIGPGFSYRLDEPRCALLLSRLDRLEAEILRRRELIARYRERLSTIPGVIVPYSDEALELSSAYVMAILLSEPERRPALRQALLADHGIQTSILYPAVHELTAYRERFPGVSLPRTEWASRAELTIPLYPHMTEAEHDRVCRAIEGELVG